MVPMYTRVRLDSRRVSQVPSAGASTIGRQSDPGDQALEELVEGPLPAFSVPMSRPAGTTPTRATKAVGRHRQRDRRAGGGPPAGPNRGDRHERPVAGGAEAKSIPRPEGVQGRREDPNPEEGVEVQGHVPLHVGAAGDEGDGALPPPAARSRPTRRRRGHRRVEVAAPPASAPAPAPCPAVVEVQVREGDVLEEPLHPVEVRGTEQEDGR